VADTYDLLSERCQGEWARGDWAANMAGGLMMAQAFGMDFDDTTLDGIEVVDFVGGESATVMLAYVDKNGEPWSHDEGDGVPWVFEGGWRMDDCESMEG
jgi:phage protein U